MQPEQQQRIMGYFIEEAKDHLNTIEQGLLNLQSTIEDQEMVNELFRAAHSVKGGAAMLGLNSIQQVSHRLEDYFKILKESPIKVDQKLESLFLQVFDALQELVGQLQGPFGLTDEAANATVAGVGHVFGELENHLNVLASSAVSAQPAGAYPIRTPSPASPARQDSAFILLFQNDIPLRLREMLQLFKQSELDSANRQQLQDLCRQLISLGEQFALPDWCNLIEKAQAAIAHPENSYRTLAPIIIRDIKQAQELILSGRAADIAPCAQLQALQPPAPLAEAVEDDFAALLEADAGADWLTEPQAATDEALFAELAVTEPAIELSERFDTASMEGEAIDQHGPEVGMAELNSLADLFEGEMPDLGSTWQEEEILTETAAMNAASSLDSADFDESSDFSDLLFDEIAIGQEQASTSSQDALTDLFSDDPLLSEPGVREDDRPLASGSSHDQNDLSDLFAGSDVPNLSAATEPEVERDASNVAFDAVFGDLNLNDEPDAELTALNFEAASDAPLDNLGAFFVGMEGEQDLAFSAFQNSYERAPIELNLDELDDDTEPEHQGSTPPTVTGSDVASIVDPWEDLKQPYVPQTPFPADYPVPSLADYPVPSLADYPVPSLVDEAIVSPATSQADSDADAFFGHDPLPEFIEELSDQDDLDFSSLLDSTTTQTPTDASEPLLEELADAGLDQSIAALLVDHSALRDDLAFTPLPADTDLAALDAPFSSADPFFSQPTTAFQPDFSDPWSVELPQQQVSAAVPKSEDLNLDFTALDFDNSATPASNADLDDSLDIDFNGFDADDALEPKPLDATAAWLVLDPAEPTIDPVSALEDPFANDLFVDEPSAIASDPLNAPLETLPDFDSFFDAAASESLSNALDDSSGTAPSSVADDLSNLFDEPTSFDESLELPEDLLTLGVPSESPSGEMTVDALNDDLLGLSALDSMDDPSIVPTDEDFNDYLSGASGAEADDEASDDWLTVIGTEATATPPFPTETTGGAESLDFAADLLGFDDLDSVIAPPASTTEISLDFGDTLDFGDELFAPQASEGVDTDALPSTEERLNFDEVLLGFDDLDSVVAPPDSTTEVSLDFGDTLDFGNELFAPQGSEGVNTDALPSTEERLNFDEVLLGFDDPNERNGIADSIMFAEAAADSDDGDAFSLEFDRSAFDALGFDSSSADLSTVSPFSDENADDDFLLAFDRPEAITNPDFDTPESDVLLDAFTEASSDFDWQAAADTEPEPSGNELGDDLLDLDRLLDESSASAATNAFGSFDHLVDEGSPSEAVDERAFADLLGDETDEFADLDSFLGAGSPLESDEFSGLEAFLDRETSVTNDLTAFDALLAEAPDSDPSTGINVFGAAAGGMLASGATTSSPLGDFADLESLLQDESLELADADPSPTDAATARTSEFADLDDLLKDAEEKMGGSPTVKIARSNVSAQNRRPTRPGKVFSEQTMRVPVKHLDNLSNLVGELVVNRNSLEEDQERLRQSLDNLLYQVQQLSDVGQRMQDLYERSLLESSLLASRQSYRSAFSAATPARESGIFAQTANATGIEYDPLEMDRFTGFHSLSQEMIELIVRVRESSSDIEFIVDETDQVTRMFRQVTTQLQEGLTRSRMVPFAQTADRLPRAVRDIAMKVGKQAELSVEGRETLIDKMILEQLYDPMTHLVNNAITHGIESPEVRRAAGKPPAGRITIRAFHQGNQTIISVSDDGAGIDLERVKVKAIEKGLITAVEAQGMTRLDLYDLLFHAGFSTKDQADDFSGRGVGMDVVRTSLSEIRGAINTDSTFGKGTTFTIRLPLTLSISKALCCISDRARIAFPMDGVEDMLDVPKERIQTNDEGQACIPWRDSLLPLRPLNDLLSYSRHLGRGNVYGGNQEDDIVSIVVLRSAGNFLALQVDQVLGEQEIVIKQLEGPIPKPVGVAGATVLGDGRIMPIADVLELIDLSMGRIRKDVGGSLWEQGGVSMVQEAPIAKTEPTVLIVDDSITVRELLSMTFNKVGYRVEQARDGQEAWEKLRAGLPCDIVFCDIEMPRMDGLELLSRIQKDPSLSHLPIAMLTSRGADRHRQMAVSFGASGYFTKPYLEEALLDAAQRMLKGEVLISNSNA